MGLSIPGIVGSCVGFVRRQHHNFKVNVLRVAFQNMFSQMTGQFQSIYTAVLGADPAQIGMVNSIGAISGALIALPIGQFADKYGPKRVFVVSAIIMAVGSMIFALARGWEAIIPALLIFLLGQRFGMVLCPFVCGTYLRSEERTMGVQLCDTVVALPVLVAPMVGAFMVAAFGGVSADGIRPLYYLSFIGYFLVSLMVLSFWREGSRRAKTSEECSLVDDYREVFAEGTAIKRWLSFSAIVSSSMAIYPVFWPLYAKEVKGADQLLLGTMSTAQYILPLCLAIPIGKLADALGKKKIFFALAPLNILSPLLLIYAPSPAILVLSMILSGVSLIAVRIDSSIRAELVPIHLLGKFSGLISFMSSLIALPFPLVAGVLYRDFGPEYVFLMVVASRVVEPLVLMTIPELKRKPTTIT